MPDILSQSVQYVKSVGPKRAESFQKIGIHTIRDLLFYFPYRYLDRRTIVTVVQAANFVVNGYEGEVTITGTVASQELIRYGKKQLFKVTMRDKTGFFDCVWFQGIKYFKNKFTESEFYAVSAKPVITKYGHLQFVHPDFDKLESKESQEFLNTGKIIPFYSLPGKLKTTNIGELSLRRIITSVVEKHAALISETLPPEIIELNKLQDLASAVKNMHLPESTTHLENARRRFKFEELFYLECLVALRKNNIKNKFNGISFKTKPASIKKLLTSLPFALTDSQLKVLSGIRQDMESDKPMNRMLQGDVGSGKTIVALIAMLIAVDSGYQAVLMAPTEILANQHYNSISKLLEEFDVKLTLLLGGQKKKEKDKNLASIELEETDIIIGTHALFEERVKFKKLGLAVIDEQHRFGVIQRSKLIDKGCSPDVLVMTATPIPRTLSMTVYGDLDLSIINEMPKNRLPIKTVVRHEKKLPDIYKFIKEKLKEGYQTYFVYPLVEESEKLDLKAAEEYYTKLQDTYFSEINVGLIHGRMNWREKEEVMLKFAEKKFDVLISTTVIEVGIDIPDANIIVINDAFRFGLSQLHQLRGRVGRSSTQGYCILVSNTDIKTGKDLFDFKFEYLSKSQIEKNKSLIRLQAMEKYTSGFDLAEIDLKLRGPGDIFGTKQSGLPELKYADITTDTEIIIEAKKAAFAIIGDDPELKKNYNQIIKQQLKNNYKENLKYSFIG